MLGRRHCFSMMGLPGTLILPAKRLASRSFCGVLLTLALRLYASWAPLTVRVELPLPAGRERKSTPGIQLLHVLTEALVDHDASAGLDHGLAAVLGPVFEYRVVGHRLGGAALIALDQICHPCLPAP